MKQVCDRPIEWTRRVLGVGSDSEQHTSEKMLNPMCINKKALFLYQCMCNHC